jgi:hypothetical protein
MQGRVGYPPSFLTKRRKRDENANPNDPARER